NACFNLLLPAVEQPQHKTWTVRLACTGIRSGPQTFGPVYEISCDIKDSGRPRKFLACREFGQIRLSWFAPERGQPVKEYQILRSKGLGQPKQLLSSLSTTSYVDSNVQPDEVYEYYVVAVDADGQRSRPSNYDSARALSGHRVWDAEVTA